MLETERGKRAVKISRLVEISDELGADPAALFRRGLQRARVNVANMSLDVDLQALADECRRGPTMFRSLRQWALNALNDNSDGVMAVEAAGVRNLALLLGCSHQELADYLREFTPPPGESRTKNPARSKGHR